MIFSMGISKTSDKGCSSFSTAKKFKGTPSCHCEAQAMIRDAFDAIVSGCRECINVSGHTFADKLTLLKNTLQI